jgi:hypothetical protein
VNIDTANTNNLAVVIWTDEEMPNTYEWRVTKVKLDKSSIATAWKPRSVADEQKFCEYRLEKISTFAADGEVLATNACQLSVPLKTTKPTIPNLIFPNGIQVQNMGYAAIRSGMTLASNRTTNSNIRFDATAGTGANFTADLAVLETEIFASVEL